MYVQEQNWWKPKSGEPYRPAIALPHDIAALNPRFNNCGDYLFKAFDPPKVLIPALALTPTTTKVDLQPASKTPESGPSQDPGPEETGSVKKTAFAATTTQAQNGPQPPQTAELRSAVRNEGSNIGPNPSGGAASDVGKGTDPPSITDSSQAATLKPGLDSSPNGDVKADSQSSSSPTTMDQTADSYTDPRLGLQSSTSIRGGLGQWSDSTSLHSSGSSNTNFRQGADTKPSSRSGTSEDSTRGTVSYSDPYGNVVKSSSQPIFTAAGHTVTAAPTSFLIAGTQVSPDGQAVNIAGTTVSIDYSSHLQIGLSTFDIGQDAASLISQVLTVGGLAITANPTAVEVAGVTLTPGGSAVIDIGTRVLLDSAGRLVVGSKTSTVMASTGGTGGLLMGGFNSTIPVRTGMKGSSSSPKAFAGTAKALRSTLSWQLMLLLNLATLILLHIW